MADIYFQCSCGKSMAIDEQAVGQIVKCVDCGAQISVPKWEYEFTCSECNTTFGAASNMTGYAAKCVVCGNNFIVPGNNPPLQNNLERASVSEQADVPIVEPQPSHPDNEPDPSAPPAVSSRDIFPPAVNRSRLGGWLGRLTSVMVVIFMGVIGSTWLISKIIRSNDGIDRAIQRSRGQEDLSAANIILEKAIKQYPLALTRASRAKKLLAENQARLDDTTSLAKLIALTKANKDVARATVLLAKAIRKYPRATNRIEAEALVKDLQTQLNDTWMLSMAIQNAMITDDRADRIELLEKTLTSCPCATNRAEAEALIAAARQQIQETEGLDQAIQQARRQGDPAARSKLLADALTKYPQATNRDAALELLGNLQTQVEGQVKDPLLKAIVSAKEQDDMVSSIQVLKEALKKNKDSPYRVEAERVLAVYQKQLLAATAEQRSALADYVEGAKDAIANSEYIFLPPNKALAGAGGALNLYDSPFVDKIVAMNYDVEVRLRKLAGHSDNAANGSPVSTNFLRYVPRLILAAKNAAIAHGTIVVVEYYLADPHDKAEAQRAKVERIRFPAISKGQIVAVDCQGIECRRPEKGSALTDDPGEKFHGIIVSVYGKGRQLLMQKCSTTKLIKACNVQTY